VVPGFAQVDGSVLSIPVHANPTGILEEHGPDGKREHPFVLPHLRHERTLTTLRLPATVEVTDLPPSALQSNSFGEYSLLARQAKGVILLEETLRFKKTTISPTDYPEFRRFLHFIAQHRRTRLKAVIRASP